MTAIEIDGVTERHGDVVAVRDFSLTDGEGEVFGYLGPNGAGESATTDVPLDLAGPTEEVPPGGRFVTPTADEREGPA